VSKAGEKKVPKSGSLVRVNEDAAKGAVWDVCEGRDHEVPGLQPSRGVSDTRSIRCKARFESFMQHALQHSGELTAKRARGS
jgi:hypothetical protein